MPITKYIKGNLLDHDGPIAHGVNCQGKMNSGVAKAIREKYPQHYEDYISQLQYFKEGRDKDDYYGFGMSEPDVLGKLVYTFDVSRSDQDFIAGIFSQENYGYDGKRYVNYAAIATGFTTLNYFDLHYTTEPQEHIWDSRKLGIPKIGAVRGGGDWSIIEQIINDATPNLEIWVYEL